MISRETFFYKYSEKKLWKTSMMGLISSVSVGLRPETSFNLTLFSSDSYLLISGRVLLKSWIMASYSPIKLIITHALRHICPNVHHVLKCMNYHDAIGRLEKRGRTLACLFDYIYNIYIYIWVILLVQD